MYENNQINDNFTEEIGDISAQRNDILCVSTHILPKPSVLLLRLERWGTNLSLPKVETRDRWEIADGIVKSFPAGRKPASILVTTFLVFELALEGDQGARGGDREALEDPCSLAMCMKTRGLGQNWKDNG
jgi:hypothetical protein